MYYVSILCWWLVLICSGCWCVVVWRVFEVFGGGFIPYYFPKISTKTYLLSNALTTPKIPEAFSLFTSTCTNVQRCLPLAMLEALRCWKYPVVWVAFLFCVVLV